MQAICFSVNAFLMTSCSSRISSRIGPLLNSSLSVFTVVESRIPWLLDRRVSFGKRILNAGPNFVEPRNRVYVDNLSDSVIEFDLHKFMAKVGMVRKCEILQTETGESKGSGIVEFMEAKAANKAIKLLHNRELCGKPVYVRKDPERKRVVASANTHSCETSNRVFVGNLAYSVTESDLRKHMAKVGMVLSCEILRTVTGESKGSGIVEFMDAETAGKAIKKLHETELCERTIHVRKDRERKGFSSAVSVRIDGISFKVKSRDLEEHMNSFGYVIRACVYQNDDGHVYGIALYEKLNDAKRAVKSLHGSKFRGKILSVRIQTDEERSEGSALFRKQRTYDDDDDDESEEMVTLAKVFLSNLSHRTRWQMLKDHCKRIGRVFSVDVYRNDRGESFGVAYYSHNQAAGRASTLLHETFLDGKRLNARLMTEADEKFIQSLDKVDENPFVDVEEKKAILPVVRVGNLSPDVTWQMLKDVAQSVGNVRFADIYKDEAGEPYGVLKYPVRAEAERAVATLQNTFILGKPIRLSIVEDQNQESVNASSSGSKSTPKSTAGFVDNNNATIIGGPTSVYVGNLSANVEWQDLKQHMEYAGEVHSAHIFQNTNGSFYGIVVYNTEFEVDRAIRELQHTELLGNHISVLVNCIPQSPVVPFNRRGVA